MVFFILYFGSLSCWKIKLFSKSNSNFKRDFLLIIIILAQYINVSFCRHNVFNLSQNTDIRSGKAPSYHDIISSMFYNFLNIYFFENFTSFSPFPGPIDRRFCPNNSNLLSCDFHNTFFQKSRGIFMYFLANSNLFFLFILLMKRYFNTNTLFSL